MATPKAAKVEVIIEPRAPPDLPFSLAVCGSSDEAAPAPEPKSAPVKPEPVASVDELLAGSATLLLPEPALLPSPLVLSAPLLAGSPLFDDPLQSFELLALEF